MVLLVLTEETALSSGIQESNRINRIFDKVYSVTTVQEAKDIAREQCISMFIVDSEVEQGQGKAFVDYIKEQDRYRLTWTVMLAEGGMDCKDVIQDYNNGLYHRYLVKPIEIEMLVDMIEDLSRKRIVEVADGNRLRIRRKSVDYFFDYDDIVFLETVEKMAYIYTTDNKHKIGRITLGELEDRLDQERFMRVHRSYIINTDYIDYIRKQNNQNLIKIKHYDNMIPVGRTYKSILGLV